MDDLKTLVFTALDNAVDGGYGPQMARQSISTVVRDLSMYDADIERYVTEHGTFGYIAIEEIHAHVKAWREDQVHV